MENSSSRMIWQRMQICAADSDGRITWTDHYDVRIHAGRRELLVPIISKDSTTGFTHRIRSFRNGTNSIRKHYTCRSKSWVQPSNASVPKHLLLEQTTVHVDENADAAPELDLQRRQIAEAHGAIDAGESAEAAVHDDYLAEQTTEREDDIARAMLCKRRDMFAAIDTVLGSIEEAALGDTQEGSDVSGVAYRGDVQVAVILIRAACDGGTLQICIVMGRKRWRGRSGGVAANTVTIAFTGVMTADGRHSSYKTRCSCYEYGTNNTCEHMQSIVECELVWDRLRSFLSRPIHATLQDEQHDEWVALLVPEERTDLASVWAVFLRAELSITTGRTYATVIVDNRRCKFRSHKRTRVKCTACPGAAGHRWSCVHERAVLEQMELNDAEHTSEGTHPEGIEDAGVDSSESSDDEHAAEAYISKYSSLLPRRFFPCKAEDAATVDLSGEILDWNNTSPADRQDPYPCIGIDMLPWCRHCRHQFDSGELTKERTLQLTTLNIGTVTIAVIDKSCPLCRKVAYCDGRDNGIFCISEKTAVTRELLDTWLYDVCSVGNTFRDTFSSWKAKATSASARVVSGGCLPLLKRRQGSKAFTCFLARLKFPAKNELDALFSCETCSSRDLDGVPYFDSMVMDGTATGILGTLPKFQRRTLTVAAPRSLPSHQYLLPPPKLRAFINEIIIGANSNESVEYFAVTLRGFTGMAQVLLVRAFFSESEFDVNEVADFVSAIPDDGCPATRKRKTDAHAVLSALKSANVGYARRLMRAVFALKGDEPTFGKDCMLDKFQLAHSLPSLELRRTAIELIRCFVADSIAGGSLRQATAIETAKSLFKGLEMFSACCHESNDMARINVCNACIHQLSNAAKASTEDIASAAHVADTIAVRAFRKRFTLLKDVASCIASILRCAVDTAMEFPTKFLALATPEAVAYANDHEAGDDPVQPEHWLDEAQRTVELFPCHPEVRPRIGFGPSSKSENMRNCRKNYIKGTSHSPGIFTVLCTCRHPILIGFSVMLQNEGISTALSVLLSRFRKLPRVCYYDNACNMMRSVTLRTPWVARSCLIVCDRFHYRQHACKSVHDPDSYPSCKHHASSGAESVNNLFSFSGSHIRFLRGANLVPFLSARAVFLNIRAKIRAQKVKNKTDIDETEFRTFIDTRFTCECSGCSTIE